MVQYYKGVSFPFRFGASGGVASSKLTPDDFSRIEESMKQIIFTAFNERIYLTEFGCNLKRHLFEITGDITDMTILSLEIKKSIARFEDRVELRDVRVYPAPDVEATLMVDVTAKIIKFQQTVTFRVPVALPN